MWALLLASTAAVATSDPTAPAAAGAPVTCTPAELGRCSSDADCCGAGACEKSSVGWGNRCEPPSGVRPAGLAAWEAPRADGAAASGGPGWNGLALTPPMGWMSWERYRCEVDCAKHPDSCINEELYRAMADRLAEDGYLEAGYSQVSIDDCWEAKSRDALGRLTANSSRFPSGIKALADHMHAKGVAFGIYSDEGTETCGGYPGSKGYEAVDARTFAEWGVDYLKLDGCFNDVPGYAVGYPAMGAALQASGRNITYSCSWPAYLGLNESAKPWEAMVEAGCNLWRNWRDIDNSWASVSSIIDHWGDFSEALQEAAGIGHWNDMDMILAGDDHYGRLLSVEEAKTQMTIWSIMASPLIMSNDLRTIKPEYKEVLLNREVIAVDQDPLGKAGRRISPKGDSEVWVRELAGGAIAVALYNKARPAKANVRADLSELLGLSGTWAARDLWQHADLGLVGGAGKGVIVDALVPERGVVLLRLTRGALEEIHI
mmetsp:Transcript_35400/g.101728  ORF Transcript_35400/g.101728 Transcript_35400/m.101728 type:complete len:488 (+) Transcript_35400:51-1514(+)